MTKKKDLKRRVRERAKKTGESYTAARKRVLEARESPDARETLEARETPDASPAQPARGQTASGAAQPEPMAPAQEQITPSPLWAGPLASKTVNLPPEVVARRQQMIVDLSSGRRSYRRWA